MATPSPIMFLRPSRIPPRPPSTDIDPSHTGIWATAGPYGVSYPGLRRSFGSLGPWVQWGLRGDFTNTPVDFWNFTPQSRVRRSRGF